VRRGRRNRVEDAEERVRVALRIAFDQLGEVEVVTGIHARPLGQLPAHGDFLVLVEQGNLYSIDLGLVLFQDRQAHVHSRIVILVTPVTLERGVEHFAQPVDDHRLLHL
jgi:hypothetical protein